jgi:hypothetical protein
MPLAMIHLLGGFFSLRGVDNVGWAVMRVLTIATFVAITYRLLPRKTR